MSDTPYLTTLAGTWLRPVIAGLRLPITVRFAQLVVLARIAVTVGICLVAGSLPAPVLHLTHRPALPAIPWQEALSAATAISLAEIYPALALVRLRRWARGLVLSIEVVMLAATATLLWQGWTLITSTVVLGVVAVIALTRHNVRITFRSAHRRLVLRGQPLRHSGVYSGYTPTEAPKIHQEIGYRVETGSVDDWWNDREVWAG